MANIIDLPDFMFNRIDRNKIPKLKKIILFIKGLIVGLINKHANGKTYTRLINLMFTNANIEFDDGLYRKKIDDIFVTDLKLTSKFLDIELFKHLWPKQLASKTSLWINRHISSGTFAGPA